MHSYNAHEVFYEIGKLMVPGSGVQAIGLRDQIVKMCKVLEYHLLYIHSGGDKTEFMNLMFIKTSAKIVNFMASVLVVQVLGRGEYDHIVKMYLILENFLIFFTSSTAGGDILNALL